ncbi:fibronectin type III domain-containing protein [Kribbella antibiotica]|uniref:Fibronectin type III domain-containing protein n=1 Tax=Kribbella antibiotica TaxID=190195 RepID=A0A4R4ZND6_9ACTN|nr:fibronectin type III domain-containing protein [Kribbella antibiotica]TDD59249.1 fibronectin type III domain-containing protein [Kribbella antibiotica]
MKVVGAVLCALLTLVGCAPADQPPVHQTFQLTASLVTDDVTLRWSGAPVDAAYLMVEYATEPNGEYTILGFLPPDKHEFEHPDLMPEATFYYRVTPLTAPEGRPATARPGAKEIQLTWTDSASDEDGYLLERRRTAQATDVAAYLDPNTTSFDLPLLPSDKPATYVPRPFRRGIPSPVTHETIPPE